MQTQTAAAGTRARKKTNDMNVRARRADGRDEEVGRRVRTRRMEQGLSQTDLANKIGVTFQQVQKYEKGVNRIGAGRLQRISEALDVPISYFFDGATGGPASKGVPISLLLQSRDSVHLLEAFKKLAEKNRRVSKIVVDLIEELAAE
jgi:transcriptional regulator with XRE-family HTH domain